MSEKLKEQLILHEGLKLKPYKCTKGKLTIGVGRNIQDVGITKDEAMVMLDNDIKRVTDSLQKYPWFQCLNDPRKDVIINMVFNMGLKTFLEFKMTIYFLEEKQYNQAAIEMLDSDWSTQVGARAKELSKIMFEGKYP